MRYNFMELVFVLTSGKWVYTDVNSWGRPLFCIYVTRRRFDTLVSLLRERHAVAQR